MKLGRKDAFVIVRIETPIKDKLFKKAQKKGKDLSKFVRWILEEWLKLN